VRDFLVGADLAVKGSVRGTRIDLHCFYVQLHLLLQHLGFASHGHILLPLQSAAAAAAAVSSSENLVDNPRKGKTLGQKIE
jgi:hypothetical protein